jgi:sarcosine oxidase subunit beta
MEVDSGWNSHQQRDGAVLLGGIDKDTHPGTDEIIDPDVTERVLDIAAKRIPLLEEARLIRSYVGLRALTPDDLPVLGPVPGVEGLYCLCGFAGHGFMHAPAAGDLIARWILTKMVRIPELQDCLPERFVRFHGVTREGINPGARNTPVNRQDLI